MLIPFGVFSAAGAGVSNSFELISTTLISTNTASVTLDVTGLGSIYKHLQIRMTGRSTSATDDSLKMQFNGDTGNNYTFHQLLGNGSSVSSGAATNVDAMYLLTNTGTNAASNIFGSGVLDILDAFSSTKNTTGRGLTGFNTAAGSSIILRSSVWLNTAAITSILLAASGGSFVAGTRLSLYGVK